MAKKLSDIFGKKPKTEVVPLSIGGLAHPDAGNDQKKFIAKHSVEIHGNKVTPDAGSPALDDPKNAALRPAAAWESLEDIHEISKKVLGNYMLKASGGNRFADSKGVSVKDQKRKELNRANGVHKASKRLKEFMAIEPGSEILEDSLKAYDQFLAEKKLPARGTGHGLADHLNHAIEAAGSYGTDHDRVNDALRKVRENAPSHIQHDHPARHHIAAAHHALNQLNKDASGHQAFSDVHQHLVNAHKSVISHVNEADESDMIAEDDGAQVKPASKFHVVHRETGKVVGKASTIKRARSIRDRHDNNYGSYAHAIKPVNESADWVDTDGDELFEGFETQTSRYEFSHGKKPRGEGNWTIGVSSRHPVNHINHTGSLGEALDLARSYAKENGLFKEGLRVNLHVMESQDVWEFDDECKAVLEDKEAPKCNKGPECPKHERNCTPVKEEVLVELSKKTIGDYVKKAHVDTAGRVVGIASNPQKKGYGSNEHYHKEWKKVKQRTKGIARGVDRLTKEEIEQLDELSRKTLASYAKGSANDMARKAVTMYSPSVTKDKRDKAANKFVGRQMGVHRATTRLAKEDLDQLDELSRNTLTSYKEKAPKSAAATIKHIDSRRLFTTDKETGKLVRKVGNRLGGHALAIKKLGEGLVKEDIDNLYSMDFDQYADFVNHFSEEAVDVVMPELVLEAIIDQAYEHERVANQFHSLEGEGSIYHGHMARHHELMSDHHLLKRTDEGNEQSKVHAGKAASHRIEHKRHLDGVYGVQN